MASASTSSAQHKDDAESDSLQNVLQQIGMDEFIPAFRDNLISLNQVNELSQSDFEKLGVVAIGNRIKIKSAVAAFLKALRDGLYKDFGVLLGMAIVHGDQWPAFFHPEFYMSMATGTNLFTIDAITDIEQKHVIMKLQQAETNEEINQVIEENYTIFTISGCYSFGKFLVAQKHQIIKNLLYFLAYSRSLPAIQQFLEGLEACGVKDAVYEYPEQLKEVFCFTKRPLTATMVEAVFSKVEFSEVGSNKRLGEERTITHWTDFLMDIEDGNSVVSLRELLSFTTGSDQIPFLGFGIDPSIEFLQEGSYPQANTCGMVLRLPIHEKYDFFKESMEFGILNSPGFGMA